MKNSIQKIIIIECVIIVLFLLNILLINSNIYVIAILLSLLLLLMIKLFGFEADRFRYKKDIMLTMINYALIFMILYYISGLYFGFLKSGYSLKLINIIKNVVPNVLIIVISEILRYSINVKSSNSKIALALSCLMFIIFDISINIHLYDIGVFSGLIEMIFNVVIISIFKNMLLTYTSLKVGYKSNILYRSIFELSVYIIPIVPNVPTYLYLVGLIILNWSLLINLMNFYTKKKVTSPKDIKIYKTPVIIATVLIIICIYFTSGVFRYASMAIGSNSMKKEFDKGDVVVFEKVNIEEIKEGQVLVFTKENKKIVHRIVKIKNENENYYITTKGDNNNENDNWVVREEEVIGIVKFKIKYIGYPTIWLSEMIGG